MACGVGVAFSCPYLLTYLLSHEQSWLRRDISYGQLKRQLMKTFWIN